jgi:hypothetical protein
MKITVEMDAILLEAAMKISGNKTISATLETALNMIILQHQEKIKSLRGKVKWEGDLDALRRG